MGTLLKKLLPKNIAAIMGIAQKVIPLLKEVIILVIRIVDIFTPDKGLEPIIVKVQSISDKIEGAIEKAKNLFLK